MGKYKHFIFLTMNTQHLNNFGIEFWKDVSLGEGFTNKRKLQVSSFGHIRSCTPDGQDYRLLRGSRQGGYAIVRFRLQKPRDAETQQLLNSLVQKKQALAKQIATQQQQLLATTNSVEQEASAAFISMLERKLAALKKQYTRFYTKTEKDRTIYMGLLVHRLVAELFCVKKSPQQTLVIHTDFNKLNNHYSNLQWATPEESIAHQQYSPYVIEDKKARSGKRWASKATKLTITRVMLIKKRLLENIPMRRLARQFKVTETQIARIRKGENWKDIPAAT